MIGFDIGGTKCSVSIGKEKDGKLEISQKKVIDTDTAVSPYEMIDRMCNLAEEMLGAGVDAIQKEQVIGISCGGPLDSQKGLIMSPPNLPGWDDVSIISYLQKKYGVKAYLQNDANACAVAEWRYGAGMGCSNMIFLTFGTGMGAGLILNGRLYTGTNDMAGEIGHVRMEADGPVGYGKAGSFEGFCSGGGIAQLGKKAAEKALQEGRKLSFCQSPEELPHITAKKIAECAFAGALDAIEIYRFCGEKLGAGLAILVDILNPERIVIGSIFGRCEALLREPVEQKLRQECLSYSGKVCQIVPAALMENIGDYAALSVAAMGLTE